MPGDVPLFGAAVRGTRAAREAVERHGASGITGSPRRVRRGERRAQIAAVDTSETLKSGWADWWALHELARHPSHAFELLGMGPARISIISAKLQFFSVWVETVQSTRVRRWRRSSPPANADAPTARRGFLPSPGPVMYASTSRLPTVPAWTAIDVSTSTPAEVGAPETRLSSVQRPSRTLPRTPARSTLISARSVPRLLGCPLPGNGARAARARCAGLSRSRLMVASRAAQLRAKSSGRRVCAMVHRGDAAVAVSRSWSRQGSPRPEIPAGAQEITSC